VQLAAVTVVTALSIPAALAVALHCAPGVDPGMLVAIARQESGLEPMTLHDNTSGQVLRGAEVIDAARRLIAAGHSVDLGAWQINSRNLALLGLGIADAFAPCKSVAAAARLLELFSRYNTGSPSRGIANGYAAGVMIAIRAVKAASPAMPPVKPAVGSLPLSAADPFATPAPTGRDLVFTAEGE
jgi:type IV secretion system protein VirB1